MNDVNDESNIEQPLERYRAPEWLRGVLEESRVPDELLRRCEQAALSALYAIKMKRQRERFGFVPLGFMGFVQGLAKLAGVPLPPLLASYGISDPNSGENLGGQARLAVDLGFARREAAALLAVEAVEAFGWAPFPLMVAAHGAITAGVDRLSDCEQVVAEIVLASPELKPRLAQIDSALREAYERLP